MAERPEALAKRLADFMNTCHESGVEFGADGGYITVFAWKNGRLHTVCRIEEGTEEVVTGHWHVAPPLRSSEDL
jgi:predicted amino acid dehydrogenase